jgi:hypothetical protein
MPFFGGDLTVEFCNAIVIPFALRLFVKGLFLPVPHQPLLGVLHLFVRLDFQSEEDTC